MNALLTLIAVFIVFESSPGVAFFPQELIVHHIAKRQTADPQDLIGCVATIIDYQCGTSGYIQQTVSIALGCRNESYARNSANTCARSENGESCGVATVRYLLSDTDHTNARSCSDNVILGSQACPVACRTFLESVKSKLGCCINTYLNTTDSPLYEFYSHDRYFDYRLWNACGVPLPAMRCENNSISLNPPPNMQDCTEQELINHLVDYQCNPSIGQPLVNTVLQFQNERCNIFATRLVDVCATNANGQACAAISFDIIASISTSSQLFDALTGSVAMNCAEDINTCSAFCQSTFTNISNSYGCCINIFNNSEVGQLSMLSYSLWNACGVDSPGFCSSSLTTSPSSASPPTSNPLTTSNDPATISTGQAVSTDSLITTSSPVSIDLLTTSNDPTTISTGQTVSTDSLITTSSPVSIDPLTTSNDPTTTFTIQTLSMDTSEGTTNQDSPSNSPSALDTSTSGSRVLAPVSWIFAMAGLLHLNMIIC